MSALVPPAPPAAEAAGPKTWRAGTLVYTSAGLLTLGFWLLWGDFAWAMRDRSVGPATQWFLSQLKVPNVLFGLLIGSLPALVNLLIGPVVSIRSDRHRGRLGRRIPFLLVITPVSALGMIGMGLTPFLSGPLHRALLSPALAGLPAALREPVAASVLCFAVFWTLFECASIASQGVFAGLVNDVVPAPLLGRFYGLFRAVSLIDGMIFNFWIIGKLPTHFTAIMLGIGTVYGLGFLWVCLKVREGDYPPPPPLPEPAPGRGAGGFLLHARAYLRECFTHPYYLSLLFMLTTAGLSFSPVNTFSIPYARSLGIGMDLYGKSLVLTFLISLGLSYFLGWLSDRFHPLRTGMAALAGYAVVTAWGSFYANTPRAFLAAWVLHGVLSGCYFTCAASLAQRLFPRSRFAQFASAAGIFGSLGGMVVTPSIGLLIDRSGNGYPHAFAAAFFLTLAALAAAAYAHGKFMKLGGPRAYVAPE